MVICRHLVLTLLCVRRTRLSARRSLSVFCLPSPTHATTLLLKLPSLRWPACAWLASAFVSGTTQDVRVWWVAHRGAWPRMAMAARIESPLPCSCSRSRSLRFGTCCLCFVVVLQPQMPSTLQGISRRGCLHTWQGGAVACGQLVVAGGGCQSLRPSLVVWRAVLCTVAWSSCTILKFKMSRTYRQQPSCSLWHWCGSTATPCPNE